MAEEIELDKISKDVEDLKEQFRATTRSLERSNRNLEEIRAMMMLLIAKFCKSQRQAEQPNLGREGDEIQIHKGSYGQYAEYQVFTNPTVNGVQKSKGENLRNLSLVADYSSRFDRILNPVDISSHDVVEIGESHDVVEIRESAKLLNKKDVMESHELKMFVEMSEKGLVLNGDQTSMFEFSSKENSASIRKSEKFIELFKKELIGNEADNCRLEQKGEGDMNFQKSDMLTKMAQNIEAGLNIVVVIKCISDISLTMTDWFMAPSELMRLKHPWQEKPKTPLPPLEPPPQGFRPLKISIPSSP